MSERWITAKEMEAICPSCAKTMNRRGIARVKESVIEEAKKVAGAKPPMNVVRDVEKAFQKHLRRNPDVLDQYDDVFDFVFDEVFMKDDDMDVEIGHDWAENIALNLWKKYSKTASSRTADSTAMVQKALSALDEEYRDIMDEAEEDLIALSEDNDVMREAVKDYFDGARRSFVPRLKRRLDKVLSELQKVKTGSSDPIKAAVREFRAARWETMPKGWTDESRKKFWDNLTSRAPKHKVTQCIKEMEGKVGDPGAFCASLADRVDPGWRSRD